MISPLACFTATKQPRNVYLATEPTLDWPILLPGPAVLLAPYFTNTQDATFYKPQNDQRKEKREYEPGGREQEVGRKR